MKKTRTLVLLTLFAAYFGFSQSNCSKFYPLEEGTSFQYTNYDKKDKVDGTVAYTISKVTEQGSSTSATFDLKYSDKKGKEIFESNYNIICDNGTVRIDYKSLFPSQMMQQYSDMDVEMDITGTDIELPSNLSVGQELPDANVSVTIDMAGIKMNIEVNQTDRKVEKQESITTPAGTYECYLLTETNTSKTMGATIQMESKLWLAEGVGMVKHETYKNNGDLMSSTQLTEFGK